ncbi:hypothetical protein BURCENK562V_C2810 [Burkholderia cenocepacia K56-2Valvano]|nr:hypothetical protein BURCENK562V_C2810 [Burkholderia cenocepacia K56-2Valvano]
MPQRYGSSRKECWTTRGGNSYHVHQQEESHDSNCRHHRTHRHAAGRRADDPAPQIVGRDDELPDPRAGPRSMHGRYRRRRRGDDHRRSRVWRGEPRKHQGQHRHLLRAAAARHGRDAPGRRDRAGAQAVPGQPFREMRDRDRAVRRAGAAPGRTAVRAVRRPADRCGRCRVDARER